MTPARRIRALPGLAFLVLCLALVDAGCSRIRIPPPQVDGDWEIAIRRIERGESEWTGLGGRVRAQEGAELVIITLTVKAANPVGEDLTIPPITLTDAAGQTYQGFNELHLSRGPATEKPTEVSLAVGVTKDVRLTTLQLRKLTFPLQ